MTPSGFELTSGATSFGKSEGWETAQVITANLGNVGSVYQMSKATGGPGGGSGIRGMPFRPTGGSTSGNTQSIGLVLWTMFRAGAATAQAEERSKPRRVWFVNFGGVAYISAAPGGTNKGVGGEVSIGLACENQTWSCQWYKSTGQVKLNDPYGGKVAGGNIGAGVNAGFLNGTFTDFFGDSTQESFTGGPLSITTIESGQQTGTSVALGSKGWGLSAVIVRTQTSVFHWSDLKP